MNCHPWQPLPKLRPTMQCQVGLYFCKELAIVECLQAHHRKHNTMLRRGGGCFYSSYRTSRAMQGRVLAFRRHTRPHKLARTIYAPASRNRWRPLACKHKGG
eukprot:377895-Pelagomonas_calceolata.AAC.16